MTTLETIKSRGHMIVVLRPTQFVTDRVPNILDLQRILTNAAVSLRGWNFPHVGQPSVMTDFIEDSVEFADIREYWRFYQSGQFVHCWGLRSDWREQVP